MLLSPLSFAAGAATWSLAEYSMHRFLGHARYFTPTTRKVKAAAVALSAVGVAGSLVVGPRRALSFVLGFGLTYAGYEI